jgi:Mrp family chromosome partitioning ATPase
MSRNFELLQELRERLAFDTNGASRPPTSNSAAAQSPVNVGSSEAPILCEHPSKDLTTLGYEELTKFVQRLFLVPGALAPRMVVLCGLEPRNGSSWLATCAAEILAAQAQGSVCLVDANLRSPAIHEHLGVENHCGFADALQGCGPLRQFTRRLSPNLWLLGCGSTAENTKGLLPSGRLQGRVHELRAEYDYVLIEAAAAGPYDDATTLARLADGMILVVEAHITRRDVAHNAKQQLLHANVRLLGTLLNNRTFPIPQTLYSRL